MIGEQQPDMRQPTEAWAGRGQPLRGEEPYVLPAWVEADHG